MRQLEAAFLDSFRDDPRSLEQVAGPEEGDPEEDARAGPPAEQREAPSERENAVGRPGASGHRRRGVHRENEGVTVQPLPDERASALLRVGLAIAAITVTAQAVAHVLGVQLVDDRYLHLNADDELGLPAWVSSSAVLFLPLFGLAALLLLRTARRLPAQLAGLVYLGLGLLVLALATELVSTALYELADVERGSWPDTLEVVLEETAELAAWILIATALLTAVSIGAREDRVPLRRKVPA